MDHEVDDPVGNGNSRAEWKKICYNGTRTNHRKRNLLAMP
jgi:hypothetical protein